MRLVVGFGAGIACTRDACVIIVRRSGREFRLLATRSATRIDGQVLVRACSEAYIAVSDRWLPRSCAPRWLKLDRKALEGTGGVAVYLDAKPRVETVAERLGEHPWAM